MFWCHLELGGMCNLAGYVESVQASIPASSHILLTGISIRAREIFFPYEQEQFLPSPTKVISRLNLSKSHYIFYPFTAGSISSMCSK